MAFGNVWSDDEIFEFEKACDLNDYSYSRGLINQALALGVEDFVGKISESDLCGYSDESLERMIEGRKRDLSIIKQENTKIAQKNLKQILHNIR